MANRERNKRSARQARQRERAAQEVTQVSVSPQKAAPRKAATTQKAVVMRGERPGLLVRARNYLRDVRSEMHRVVWPSRSELVNYSVAVIVMLIVFGVLVWAVDTGFVALLVAFTGLRG